MYNAAVIGLGFIGMDIDYFSNRKSGHSHIGAINKVKDINLVAGCDKNKAKLKRFDEFFGLPTYDDIENMMHEQRPDIVILAVPPAVQTHLISKAIQFRPKCIVCEKPFVKDEIEGKFAIEQCRMNDIHLTVAHWMRWSNKWQYLKKLIDNDELGNLLHIRYIYSKGVFNSGTHAFDILRFLFGEVKNIKVISGYYLDTGEFNIDGNLSMENGLNIELRTINYRDHFTTELDVIGTKGRVTINNEINHWEISRENNNNLLLKNSISSTYNYEEFPFISMYEDIVQCLKNGNRPACTGEDGLKAYLIAQQFYDTLKSRGV